MNGNIIARTGLIILGLLMVFSSVFACSSDADCESWEMCDAGSCVPEPGRCDSTSDCDSGEACDEDTHQCFEPIGECILDSDCEEWEECENTPMGNLCLIQDDRCVADSNCDDDEWCSSDHYCVDYECVSDSDCESWEMCDDNECVPEPGRCEDDSDCDPGEVCDGSTHQCFEPSDECSSDDDCEEWEECESTVLGGVCTLRDGRCYSNSNCPGGYFCNNNHECERKDDDDDDDDDDSDDDDDEDDDDDNGKSGCRCKSSEACINGKCVKKEGWCDSASDCNPWEMCSGHECVMGPERCATDSDCDSPREECDLDTYRCVLSPGYCSRDRDCAFWEECDAGLCVVGSGMCNSDSDCDEDELCDADEHICKDAPVKFECDPVPTEGELCGPYMDIISDLRGEMNDLRKSLGEKEEEEPILGGDFLFMLLGGIALLALGGLAGWHGNNHFSSMDEGEGGEYESGGGKGESPGQEEGEAGEGQTQEGGEQAKE